MRNVSETLADPQIDARGMIASLEHHSAGTVRVVNSPIVMSGGARDGHRPPPALGEHTDPILTSELGLSAGFPVIAWTTVDFSVPTNWVQWDTSIGPIRTTFAEHAVVVVGYDEHNVYVNDPLSGLKAAPVEKSAFLATWEAMGKQALTYTKKKE